MQKLLFLILLLVSMPMAYADYQSNPVNQSYLYKFSSWPTASSTTVKTSAGILHTLTVTGGTAATIDIYDGIGSAQAQIASYTATNALQTYILDVGFSSGCTVSTGGPLKFTVSYL